MSDKGRALYEPADFFVLRAPLLPLETYRTLHRRQPLFIEQGRNVRRALAVGSMALLEAGRIAGADDSRRGKLQSKLLRYMIRMSTRPTPFGLFAGVAIGRWSERTDLALSVAPRRQRTRPDMAWLMKVVIDLESIPDVRRHLRVRTNSAALIRAGRVFLAERVSRGEGAPLAVSIRATGPVRCALAAARTPIALEALASLLLAESPGATPEKVDALLTGLWHHTLLLTDLRPPLTVASPARYVLDRLEQIPAAAVVRAQILSVLDRAEHWDGSIEPAVDDPQDLEGPDVADAADRYRAMVADAAQITAFERSPYQVDSAVQLAAEHVSGRVGERVAAAAEILLRLSPFPDGPAHLAIYRQLFAQRYGMGREVPLLELLDPNFGLGPPPVRVAAYRAGGALGPARASRRARTLLELATDALHRRTRSVELNEEMLERLETSDPAMRAPTSLDLYVSVAARSKEALDGGDFLVVIEPNVGVAGAGRGLGRFADLLPGATDVLSRAAALEEARTPGPIAAELSYQPRSFRLGNVSIRPNVRPYEIAAGVASGRDASHTIPLDELVVGIRDERFYVRWPTAGRDVTVTAGHMLRPLRAPAVCRFLSDVGRDGCCQLAAFDWGPASTFPFLPRVQAEGVVLALAQWRFAATCVPDLALDHPDAFYMSLRRWCAEWQVPRHVYLTAGDNRLLLDLTAKEQVDELRRATQSRRSGVLLTEVFPDFDHAWVCDTNGRAFVTELVVPLISTAQHVHDRPARAATSVASRGSRLHPPGSNWLFAKLYAGRALEDDLIAGPLRHFAGGVLASGLAAEWFFVRYSDPDRHVRVRFRGEQQRLLRDLVPALSEWVNKLIREDACGRFALDTYEQEIERFGGPGGMRAAEMLFAADSQAVADLLELLQSHQCGLDRRLLAVMTVDTLLDGFGLGMEARFRWCRGQVRSRHAASRIYREWKVTLRTLLTDADLVQGVRGASEIAGVLERLRGAAGTFRQTLADLESASELTRTASEVYPSVVHLHLNRLLGGDAAGESEVIALLWRAREGLYRSAARVKGHDYSGRKS